MSKSIYISAGHSETDPGAVAKHDGVEYHEAKIVTIIRDKIVERLNTMPNITVYSDGYPGLNKDRNVAIAEAKKVKGPRIDIHLNASENPKAGGTETISNPKYKVIAQEISEVMATVLGTRLRGDDGWINQSQSKRGKLAWISQIDGILLEVCFLSHPLEFKSLMENMDGLVDSLADYLYDLAQKW